MAGERSIYQKLFAAGGASIVGQITSFVGVVLYANSVPSDILGQYFLLISVVSVSSFLATAGISTNVTRRVGKQEESRQAISAGLLLASLVAAFVIIALIGGSEIIESYLNRKPLALYVLIFPTTLAEFMGAVLRGEEKADTVELVDTGRRILMYAGGVILVSTGQPAYESFTLAYFVGRTSQLSLLKLTSRYTLQVPSRTTTWEFFLESRYLYFSRFTGLGFEWIDTLLIGAFLSPAAVAAYEIVWRFSAFSNIGTNTTVSVFFPRFAALQKEGNFEKLTHYVERAYFYAPVLIIPVCFGTLVVGSDLLGLVYGEEYRYVGSVLFVLFLGRYLYSLSRISSSVLYSGGDDIYTSTIDGISVVINAVGNLLMIPTFGIIGAAVATSLAYGVNSLGKGIRMNQNHTLRFPIRRTLRAVGGAVIMTLIVSQIGFEDSLVTLVARILVGGAVFTGVILLLDVETRRDIRRIILG